MFFVEFFLIVFVAYVFTELLYMFARFWGRFVMYLRFS